MVYKLYNAAMSHPFPEEWLEECLNVYQVENIEDLRKTNWIRLLWETLDEKVIQAEALAESARRLCEEPDGPYIYEEALADDLNFWREIRRLKVPEIMTRWQRLSQVIRLRNFQQRGTVP